MDPGTDPAPDPTVQPDAGELRIVVDRAACRGYANCLDAAPDVFDLDDHDIAVTLRDHFPLGERDRLQRAVDRCPARALELIEPPPDAPGPGPLWERGAGAK